MKALSLALVLAVFGCKAKVTVGDPPEVASEPSDDPSKPTAASKSTATVTPTTTAPPTTATSANSAAVASPNSDTTAPTGAPATPTGAPAAANGALPDSEGALSPVGAAGSAAPALAGNAGCDAAATNALALQRASGNAAIAQQAADSTVAETAAKCRSESWPAAAVQCIAGAKTVETLYRECYLLPFRGQPLTTNRRFHVDKVQEIRDAQPGIFEQHGDYFEVAPNCGFLQQRISGFAVLFLTCDGKTNPLLMPDEVKEAFASMSADETTRHRLATELTARLKTNAFGGWKVCDAFGANCRVQ